MAEAVPAVARALPPARDVGVGRAGVVPVLDLAAERRVAVGALAALGAVLGPEHRPRRARPDQVANRRHRERRARDRRPRQRAAPGGSPLEQPSEPRQEMVAGAHGRSHAPQARGTTVYTSTVAYSAAGDPDQQRHRLRRRPFQQPAEAAGAGDRRGQHQRPQQRAGDPVAGGHRKVVLSKASARHATAHEDGSHRREQRVGDRQRDPQGGHWIHGAREAERHLAGGQRADHPGARPERRRGNGRCAQLRGPRHAQQERGDDERRRERGAHRARSAARRSSTVLAALAGSISRATTRSSSSCTSGSARSEASSSRRIR